MSKINVQIITVGNNVYLAAPLKFDDKGVIITKAMPLPGDDVTVQDLKNYMKHANSGTLEQDINVMGNNVTYSWRELSEDTRGELDILEAKFKKAEKVALPNLVNQAFDRLV